MLDVHWYPEARGSCVANPMDGCRVTEENTDAGVVAARKQAPRSLWDPTYTETSWITQCCTGGPIRLLPRLKDKITANYPGTRLAITEYNYGGAESHLRRHRAGRRARHLRPRGLVRRDTCGA